MRSQELIHRGNRTEIVLLVHERFGPCIEKRLLPFCDVEEERDLLAHEAQIQGQFDQGCVVPILGTGRASLYRKYIAAPTLAQWHSAMTKDEGIRAHIALGLACCLNELHQSTVHGDLTPGNVYIVDGPQVLVSDFGLAQPIAATAPLRRGDTVPQGERQGERRDGGARLGTPRFLAPELLTGAPLTEKCDIYQLGLLIAWLHLPVHDEATKAVERSTGQENTPGRSPLTLREEWLHLGRWHKDARRQLQSFGLDALLNAEPRARPLASECVALIQSQLC